MNRERHRQSSVPSHATGQLNPDDRARYFAGGTHHQVDVGILALKDRVLPLKRRFTLSRRRAGLFDRPYDSALIPSAAPSTVRGTLVPGVIPDPKRQASRIVDRDRSGPPQMVLKSLIGPLAVRAEWTVSLARV